MSSTQEKAEQLIIKAVIAAAGGALFLHLDWAVVISANAALVVSLGKLHGHNWSEENASRFIRKLIEVGGIGIGVLKGTAYLVMLTGVGLAVGAGMNGLVNAVLTHAVGRAANRYFESNGSASDDEINGIFLNNLSVGGFKIVVGILKKFI